MCARAREESLLYTNICIYLCRFITLCICKQCKKGRVGISTFIPCVSLTCNNLDIIQCTNSSQQLRIYWQYPSKAYIYIHTHTHTAFIKLWQRQKLKSSMEKSTVSSRCSHTHTLHLIRNVFNFDSILPNLFFFHCCSWVKKVSLNALKAFWKAATIIIWKHLLLVFLIFHKNQFRFENSFHLWLKTFS